MVRGTQEWRDAVQEVNDQVIELIQKGQLILGYGLPKY